MTAAPDVARPGQRSAEAEAALAAIRARTSGHRRRADRVALLDGGPVAAAGRPASGGGLLIEVDRSGRVRVAVPDRARRRVVHPTGQQTPCVPCAAAGVDRRGVSREGTGSDPLCMSCWLGRRDRARAVQRRRLVAELRERLDVPAPVGCAACGAVEPVPTCWLCGYSWLAEARAAQERADAEAAAAAEAEAAAEAARVAEEFARIAGVARAEKAVDEAQAWAQRVRSVLDGFGPGASAGRAVWLLADALHRDAGARSTRRGRPAVASRRVWGVLAVSARHRSGRGAMPGRKRSAELAGTVQGVVTAAWARAEAIEWAERVEKGRRLSMEERIATGRPRDRAVFDLAPLHRGDAAGRAAFVPAALAILADLLERAVTLLDDAQRALDAARGQVWVHRPEWVRRARTRSEMAAVVARIRAVATTATDVLTASDAASDIDGNFHSPHTVYSMLSVYSCSVRGFGFTSLIASLPLRKRGRRTRRGEKGASRSPARGSRADLGGSGSHSLQRPRSAQRACAPSRTRRARPEWTGWAYGLAEALPRHWAWTEKIPLPRRAAILGPRLGPGWNPGGGYRDDESRRAAMRGADALATFVDRTRPVPVLNDPDNPTGYLVRILEEALASGEEPPHWSARAAAHQREQENARRALVAAQAAAQREHAQAARADAEAQGTAARVERAGSGAARRAALAAAAAAARGDHATARAISAADAQEWPQVAQPGAGLPAGLER